MPHRVTWEEEVADIQKFIDGICGALGVTVDYTGYTIDTVSSFLSGVDSNVAMTAYTWLPGEPDPSPPPTEHWFQPRKLEF